MYITCTEYSINKITRLILDRVLDYRNRVLNEYSGQP